MKGELDGKIMIIFVGCRPRTYACLTDDYKERKKAAGTKKYFTKQELKIDYYIECP